MPNDKLENLFSLGTPEKIKQLYRAFAQETKTRSFGLLEEDLVILDTETTGLSFKNDALIEIAAARISGREIVDTFKTFVKSPKAIPAEITELTSITNEDVRDAPSAEEAVSALAEFTSGSPVVAHNATFDRTFIEKVPGGTKVSDIWIDSLALSRIALPRLKSHALSVLAEAFQLDSVSHRAMDDVEALVGLWRVMLVALSHFEPGFLSTLAHMHPEVTWPYRYIFAHLHAEVSGTQNTAAKTPFSLRDARSKIMKSKAAAPRDDVREKEEALKQLSDTNIEESFSAEGTVGKMYSDYEPRSEQIKMAKAVVRALNNEENLAVEAGTGVGKSIAYLLPLAIYARENNVTCGVATKSIALTDQLMGQELPALADALAQTEPLFQTEKLRFTSLKGYDHYPCLRKVERALSGTLPLEFVENSIDIAAVDQLNALAVIMANTCQAPEGDLDSLGIRWRNVPKTFVSSTSEECQRKDCPYFLEGCPLHDARRRAASADIVATNHALLLRDIATDGNILPPIAHWVVDEAHSFPGEARRQWAREVSAPSVRSAFEHLGGLRTGAIHALMVQLKGSEAATTVMGLLTKATHELDRAMIASTEFFDVVGDFLGGQKNGGYADINLWIGQNTRETAAWAELFEKGSVFLDLLKTATKTLGEAAQLANDTLEHPDAMLTDATRVLLEQSLALELILDGTNDAYVYSIFGRTGKGRRGDEKLIAQPIDVGAAFAENFYPNTLSVMYCSATIAVGADFAHFDEEVGLTALSREAARNVQLSSTFDFDEQMAVLFANDMPSHADGGYHSKLADVLFNIHQAMDGSTLTLFTNRRDMEAVFEKLAPRLEEIGLELEQQSRRESPWRVQKRFLDNKKMSLFALKSFWEGIDARGDTLRCVVIPKLPFANPNEPLIKEREARDRRSWFRYCLPDAVLTVKQAAGRLIRSANDTGILVMCDERILSKQYGQFFRVSMPSKTQSDISVQNIGDYIALWRKSHER